MIKKITNPKAKIIKELKKFKNKSVSSLNRQELDELIILLAKKEGYLLDV